MKEMTLFFTVLISRDKLTTSERENVTSASYFQRLQPLDNVERFIQNNLFFYLIPKKSEYIILWDEYHK